MENKPYVIIPATNEIVSFEKPDDLSIAWEWRNNNANRQLAQVFTAPDDMKLYALGLHIDSYTPVNMIVTIRTVDEDGKPTDVILGTNTYLPSEGYTTAYRLLSFDKIRLQKDEKYAIVIQVPDGDEGFVALTGSWNETVNIYPEGQLYYNRDDAGWSLTDPENLEHDPRYTTGYGYIAFQLITFLPKPEARLTVNLNIIENKLEFLVVGDNFSYSKEGSIDLS